MNKSQYTGEYAPTMKLNTDLQRTKSMEKSLLEKLIVEQLVKNFSDFYGTWVVNVVFITPHYWIQY
jgi:hypothetical protein